ncbi:TetR/AcrR family transcriptional regulator [Streptomyces sp. XM4011]|uniref:Polyketide synthase 12 n=1 Tax=Streptomyces harbinensis TaxID=1176198 RepID=A0A1I6U678_9ACTN|nr:MULTISPECIES: TetR/AcrR family transcriptional regulator [Streptomyces]MCK1815047.1 TetR/AcrR family transcriptional regulator [Streptomyces sp. XM4011]SFS97049.1 polyketide synthase 12 [Streptomyces harbinensis]
MDPFLVPFGTPRPERADAVRNREHLLRTAREMIAAEGVDKVTMDGLAERAGLGKGTVFRRFGTRAGIFRALLDADERRFQEQVLSGPPPLGPGAEPVERLIAYGRARTAFLLDHQAIARAGLDRNRPVPASGASLTQLHLRMLLLQAAPMPHLDAVTVQLTAALEGPLVLYLSRPEGEAPLDPGAAGFFGDAWQTLIERLVHGPQAAPARDSRHDSRHDNGHDSRRGDRKGAP